MIVFRVTRQIERGKWADFKALHDKLIARYVEIGMPRPKDYRLLFGGDTTDTWIGDNEWESLSALDAAFPVLLADPELAALRSEFSKLVTSSKREILEVL